MSLTKNYLKVLNWNIRGIYDPNNVAKQQHFYQLIRVQKPDIITLQEWSVGYRCPITKIPKFKNPFLPLSNLYHIHLTESTTAILTRKYLHGTPIKYTKPPQVHPNFTDNVQITAVRIKLAHQSLCIGSYYISPKNAFAIKPLQLFHYTQQQNHEINIFNGDSNIHHPFLGDKYINKMGPKFIPALYDNDLKVYNHTGDPTHEKGGHMDIILGDPHAHLSTIHTHPTWRTTYTINSDHYPQTYNIHLTHKNQPTYQSSHWNLNSKRWSQYTSQLEKAFKNWKWKHPNNPTDNYNDILFVWKQIATNTIGTKNLPIKTNPLVDQQNPTTTHPTKKTIPPPTKTKTPSTPCQYQNPTSIQQNPPPKKQTHQKSEKPLLPTHQPHSHHPFIQLLCLLENH